MTVFDADCRRCPRLVDCREASARRFPGYHGAPVASFGDPAPQWLIVGLAPGLHGANRTGRPFTGDHAGILLYETLHALGASTAAVSVHPDDGLQLKGVRVTNSVKCLPPANKPLPAEIRACNGYLTAELETLAPRVVVALGRIAHDAVLDAVGVARSSCRFGHGAEHRIVPSRSSISAFSLVDSYHCSRYNTQTRRLTPTMFLEVLGRAQTLLATSGRPSAVR